MLPQIQVECGRAGSRRADDEECRQPRGALLLCRRRRGHGGIRVARRRNRRVCVSASPSRGFVRAVDEYTIRRTSAPGCDDAKHRDRTRESQPPCLVASSSVPGRRAWPPLRRSLQRAQTCLMVDVGERLEPPQRGAPRRMARDRAIGMATDDDRMPCTAAAARSTRDDAPLRIRFPFRIPRRGRRLERTQRARSRYARRLPRRTEQRLGRVGPSLTATRISTTGRFALPTLCPITTPSGSLIRLAAPATTLAALFPAHQPARRAPACR